MFLFNHHFNFIHRPLPSNLPVEDSHSCTISILFSFLIIFLNRKIVVHSVLKLFTGFATAAFIAWKLIVNNAISNAAQAAAINTHQLMGIL